MTRVCWLSWVCQRLLHEEEGAEGEGVDAGTVEAADGATGIGDEGLAEQIEGGVDKNGCGSGFAKFVEEFPEERTGLLVDGVNTYFPTLKSKAFEAGARFGE